MSWSDRPTYNQIETLFRWFEWHMDRVTASAACQYLRENATRKEVSGEIKRIGELYHAHALNEAECLNTKLWDKFKEGQT